MRGILIGLALALAALPAWAYVPDAEWSRCAGSGVNASLSLDARIANCTQSIMSGNFSGEDLGALLVLRGGAYDNKGLYDLAIADHTKAIALKPDNADAFYNRGNAYRHKGLNGQAILDYTKALALLPDFAKVYFNRALAYEKNGQPGLAISDYRASLRFYPGNADMINALKRLGVTP